MLIERKDIEIIVQTIIDERLKCIAEALAFAAYCELDRGGTLEREAATIYETIKDALTEEYNT